MIRDIWRRLVNLGQRRINTLGIWRLISQLQDWLLLRELPLATLGGWHPIAEGVEARLGLVDLHLHVLILLLRLSR